MRDVIQIYSWDEEVYDSLVKAMQNGDHMWVDYRKLGTIISVEKKEYQDGIPYIEVIFEI